LDTCLPYFWDMVSTTSLDRSRKERIQNWMFRRVHHNSLVYNTCWEDPRCDRALMDFDQDSEIVMITSAGCNALEYLLDDPAKIHCVDVNFRQNALLELKLAAFQQLTFDQLFQLFGKGFHPNFPKLFESSLETFLPRYAREYWRRNLHAFSPRGLRKSFYFHGSSGTFAWLAGKYLRSKKSVRKLLTNLFEAQSLDEQSAIYVQLEGRLFKGFLEWVLNRHLMTALIGVPKSQKKLFLDQYQAGVLGYVQSCLRNVFTNLPVADNYFYRLYAFGQYSNDCCPEYLKESNYNLLKERKSRIQTHTMALAEFLWKNPGPYSHFVLLDHQDWLAEHAPEALFEEWRLILENSRPGTKILLRSAAAEISFLPAFVKDAVWIDTDLTAVQHQLDRVGTYASCCLAVVR
jgi:S-adenosylmethionine-diacylglycerol 3-amino-3-carboxypropyl transferase